MTQDQSIQEALAHAYTDSIRKLLTPNHTVVITDYPDHPNVGDSAIYLGEVQALKRIGVKIAMTNSLETYSKTLTRQMAFGGNILVHGGGNIAVGYSHHDAHRIRVLKAADGIRTIQLPQSLNTDDPKLTSAMLNRLKKLGLQHLLVRDRPSLTMAQDCGMPATLLPDAVHLLGSIECQAAAKPIQILGRTDNEKRDDNLHVQSGAEDWLGSKNRKPSTAVRRKLAGKVPAALISRLLNPSVDQWTSQAERTFWYGVKLLSQGDVIVTDRLHALLIGVQMGRHVVVLPTRNRKIQNYVETWLEESRLITWASSASDAVAIANDLSCGS